MLRATTYFSDKLISTYLEMSKDTLRIFQLIPNYNPAKFSIDQTSDVSKFQVQCHTLAINIIYIPVSFRMFR